MDQPCESVHTFFMKFPIDLVYIDKQRKVRKVRHAVPAWRLSACLTAHSVLELPAGTVGAHRHGGRRRVGHSKSWAEMRIRLTIAMAAALTSSCVHETRVAGAARRACAIARPSGTGRFTTPRMPATAITCLKTLRQRVAAEPDNIAVRLELAQAYRERGYHGCRARNLPAGGGALSGIRRGATGAGPRAATK